MKKLIVFLMVAFVGITAEAQEKVKKNKNAKYDIEVNGNCEMCKKRIEKAAYSVKGVKSAQWHQDHQDVHIILDENRTTIEEVHQAIAQAGHDTDKVKADDEAYEKLHYCCMYERKK